MRGWYSERVKHGAHGGDGGKAGLPQRHREHREVGRWFNGRWEAFGIARHGSAALGLCVL